MACFFKSKTKNTTGVSAPPSSQASAESDSALRNSSPSDIAPPNSGIKELESKVNELVKLKDRFTEMAQMMDKLKDLQMEMATVKEDMSKRLGYSLALRLINQVSQITDSTTDKSTHIRPAQSNYQWGLLNKNYHFKRFLDKNPDLLPKSGNVGKNQKSGAEQLYLELKALKEKGYLEALKIVDPDLHGFLSLSDIIGTHFLAGPRITQITAHMLLRSRIELGINWQVWERCPSKWVERCNSTAEPWFQIVMECINGKDQDICDRWPNSLPELAQEFDGIEEYSRRIHGLPPREIHSFDKIAEHYKAFKESGLLTAELRNKYFVCCTFLDCASEIRGIYKTRIADNKERKVLRDSFGRPLRASGTSTLKPAPDTGRITGSTTSQSAASSDKRKQMV